MNEDRMLNQLRARDFRDAILTVAAFEAAQTFSRGIGIDWSKSNIARDGSGPRRSCSYAANRAAPLKNLIVPLAHEAIIDRPW
jgi:hypothetical protein